MASQAKKPKPVYSVAPAANGYAVQADGAPMKTPASESFVVPTQQLAETIVDEWQAQGDKINPDSMPMTQLAATSIDIAGKNRDKITDQLLAYIGSELLCHRADEPAELVALQKQEWQPLLDWCEQHFDVLMLAGSGIMPIKQQQDTYDNLRHALGRYDVFQLTGLRQAVEVSGSLVLGLALIEKHATPDQVFAASELDATFQMQKWGEDPASTHRRTTAKRELEICARWFDLLNAA
ncbi:MAG TPA: ATP12 family protein [Alphaproteobacteria bacterium]|nr:ATP12 family protein [Alphaproteobacteria bacterium]